VVASRGLEGAVDGGPYEVQRQGRPPLGVGETPPGRDSQARQSSGVSCHIRALNARTRVQEQVRARERRARVPSSGAGPARGGTQPSSEADPARGGVRPSSEADLARGSVYPSSEADFTRGVSVVSSWRAAGATVIVVVLCMRVRCVSRFAFAFFAGFKRASPGYLGDP
jgi:hypothetical protein